MWEAECWEDVILAPLSLHYHGEGEKVWADTLYSCMLHEGLPKGVRATNWNNKKRKALFWIRLLSENSGYLLLYAVNLPKHALPLREGGLQFGGGGGIYSRKSVHGLFNQLQSKHFALAMFNSYDYISITLEVGIREWSMISTIS